MRQARLLTSAVLLALLAAPGAAGAGELPLRAPGATGPLGDERLSDEITVTRFTRANRRASVFAAPRSGARRVARLRFATEDNYTETYIALEARRVDGETWIRVRVPKRPNGTTGWTPRWALRELRLVRTRMVIDRRALRATLFRRGEPIWTSRIGIGKAGTPTPRGSFWIRERIRMKNPGGVYGPWAFGTAAYSVLSDWPGGGVIGIHGTNAPGLLPGRVSAGCVRVPNHKVRRLARLMPVGTPVLIR